MVQSQKAHFSESQRTQKWANKGQPKAQKVESLWLQARARETKPLAAKTIVLFYSGYHIDPSLY